MISQLGHTMVHTADSVIVGHFAGTIPLAAVSLVNSVFMVVMVIGLGLAFGLTPLVAQENGRNRKDECAKLLSNSIVLNIIAGILLFIFVYFGSMAMLNHLDQDPAVVKEAKPFLLILSLSILPIMVFSAFKQFAEGLGFTKQAMRITIWGNVVNIVLAVIFVKGMFGIEPMGISGVGYATLIDRCLMALVMGIYIFKSRSFRPYIQHFRMRAIDRARSFQILKIGSPVAMQYVFEVGAFAAAAILAGQLGAIEQASHQVAINLASMTYMMASGIASAATIQVGTSYGKNNIPRLFRFSASSYHIVLVFMILAALIFAIFNHQLPWIYTSDKAVILFAAQLLIIAGFFQLFDGTQAVGLGILRGMSDVNTPTFIVFFSYWIVGLPLGWVMGFRMGLGLQGIWYGLTIGLMISTTLLYLRYRAKSRQLKLAAGS